MLDALFRKFLRIERTGSKAVFMVRETKVALILQALACADLSSELTYQAAAALEFALANMLRDQDKEWTSPPPWYDDFFGEAPTLNLELPATAFARWQCADWEGNVSWMERARSWADLLLQLKLEFVQAGGGARKRRVGASFEATEPGVAEVCFKPSDDVAMLAATRDSLREMLLDHVRGMAFAAAAEGAAFAAGGGAPRSDDACVDALAEAALWDATGKVAPVARTLDFVFHLKLSRSAYYNVVSMKGASAAAKLMHVLGWRVREVNAPAGGGGGGGGGGASPPRGGASPPRSPRAPFWPGESGFWVVEKNQQDQFRLAAPEFRRAALEVLRAARVIRNEAPPPALAQANDRVVTVVMQDRRHGSPDVVLPGPTRVTLEGVPLFLQEVNGPCALFAALNALMQRAIPPDHELDVQVRLGQPVHHQEAAMHVLSGLLEKAAQKKTIKPQMCKDGSVVIPAGAEFTINLSDVRDLFMAAIEAESSGRLMAAAALVKHGAWGRRFIALCLPLTPPPPPSLCLPRARYLAGVKPPAYEVAVKAEADAMKKKAAKVAAEVVQPGSTGLDVKPQLGAALFPAHDETARLFSYLRLPLLHGWLPAPGLMFDDVDVSAVLRAAPGLTVDDLDLGKPAGITAAQWAALQKYKSSPNDFGVFGVTQAGVSAIREALAPGEFGVLYGGRHYSTVFKFPIPRADGLHSLYRLVMEGGTGLRRDGLAAWQRFEDNGSGGVILEDYSTNFESTAAGTAALRAWLLQQLAAGAGGGGGDGDGADGGMDGANLGGGGM